MALSDEFLRVCRERDEKTLALEQARFELAQALNENRLLDEQIAKLRSDLLAAATRIEAQSNLLSKKAEAS